MHTPQSDDNVWPPADTDPDIYRRYKAEAERLRREAIQRALRRLLRRKPV